MKSKLAMVSLVLGLVTFINLFGMEKAIAAIVFGAIALKEIVTNQELKGRNFAYAGIILGSLYILILVGVLIVKGPEMVGLLKGIK